MSVFTAKIVTNSSITAVVDGRPLTVDNSHVNFGKIREALRADDADEFIRLYDVVSNVHNVMQKQSGGKVTLVDEVIHYDGKPMHNEMTRRFIQLLQEGEDITYLLRFIEKLMSNPSKRAIDELYTFLSHKHLPITEDGDFLAYKCVRENYMDKHSGKFDNKPGSVMEMPRNAVDDNCNNTCSYGFHAGSLEYSGPQGAFWSQGDKVIIVRINPADVVSIPADYSAQKLRTCKYVVIDDYRGPLTRAVYSGKGVDDDDFDYNEYNDEIYDAEVCDDNEIEANDLEEGDIIEFDYVGSSVASRRHASVEEIDWDEGLATCVLVTPEHFVGQYRNFRLDRMSKIVLKQ
jgi:hypothetical protein